VGAERPTGTRTQVESENRGGSSIELPRCWDRRKLRRCFRQLKSAVHVEGSHESGPSALVDAFL
jgi:hypothetical protein